jgi:hypothetical protein
LDSLTIASPPLQIQVPGIPVTATATPVAYTYGTAVPAISGTVTGIPSADQATLKATFVTAATSSSPIGVYPINVVFSGAADAANYGYGSYPPVYATGSTTTLATVTENAAALKVTANNATTVYGAGNYTFTSVVTGLVNGDKVAESYTPAATQPLAAGTYPIVPTVIGKAKGNYTVAVTNGTLTVTTAPTVITVAPAATSMLPANIGTNPIVVSVGTGVPGGFGTPTGSVTITDTFTPITATAPGVGTTAAPVKIGPLTLTSTGSVSYTITSSAVGTHVYTVAYSGDSNFQASTTAAPTSILVDTADFTVSTPPSPIQVSPGVIPGGLGTVFGEQTAYPETAIVSITQVLGFTGTVYLGCIPQNPSYINCTLTPPAVSVSAAVTPSLIAVCAPATLPLGYTGNGTVASNCTLQAGTAKLVTHPGSIRSAGPKVVLAFLPLGLLAFCVRKRRRLSRALWMLLLMTAIGTGLNGCADNSVAYFSPIPTGLQNVTIYACSVQSSCTAPITGTGPGLIRSFTVQIAIQ